MKKFVLSLAIVGVLAFASVSEAGRIGGPGSDVFTVQGYQSVSYNITFEGGKVAEVAIVGDGRTDLDLFVYDASGKLIRQGIGPIWLRGQERSSTARGCSGGREWLRHGRGRVCLVEDRGQIGPGRFRANSNSSEDSLSL